MFWTAVVNVVLSRVRLHADVMVDMVRVVAKSEGGMRPTCKRFGVCCTGMTRTQCPAYCLLGIETMMAVIVE